MPTKAERILEYFRSNPRARSKHVAVLFETSRGYVSKVRSEAGLTRVPDGEISVVASAVAQTIRSSLMEQPDLCVWLRDTCPQGATMGDYVRAIIRDAADEDQG